MGSSFGHNFSSYGDLTRLNRSRAGGELLFDEFDLRSCFCADTLLLACSGADGAFYRRIPRRRRRPVSRGSRQRPTGAGRSAPRPLRPSAARPSRPFARLPPPRRRRRDRRKCRNRFLPCWGAHRPLPAFSSSRSATSRARCRWHVPRGWSDCAASSLAAAPVRPPSTSDRGIRVGYAVEV